MGIRQLQKWYVLQQLYVAFEITLRCALVKTETGKGRRSSQLSIGCNISATHCEC